MDQQTLDQGWQQLQANIEDFLAGLSQTMCRESNTSHDLSPCWR